MQPVGPFLGLGGTLAVFLGQTICLHAQSIVVPSFLAVLVRGGQGSRAGSTASQGSHQPGGSRGSHGQSSSGSEWKPSPSLRFSPSVGADPPSRSVSGALVRRSRGGDQLQPSGSTSQLPRSVSQGQLPPSGSRGQLRPSEGKPSRQGSQPTWDRP